MDDILTVERVTKEFGSLVAVNALSFAVRRGEIFGIAGPNGSGKSTLFNLLTRIPFGPDRGRVVFDGRAVERLPPHAICRLGMARTFQKETAFGSLGVRENVRIGGIYGRGDAPPDHGDAIREALETTGLERIAEKPGSLLTVFEKKLLMFATAIATRPKLLLLDEPASGLTPPEIERLAELIRTLNGRGVTVVVIEHVLPLLLDVSERLLVLNYGEKLVLGDPDEVIRDERVVEAYLGRAAEAARA